MASHGRRICVRGCFLLFVVAGVAFCGAGVTPAQPPRSTEDALHDAELADVFFVDPDRGWAVGDRGVIWHTDDAGRHWRQQTSPVACRLESVHFVDDRNGWIVGGWTHPYTHFASGVVLRTFDGGQRWEPVPRLALPTLKRVEFQDLKNGWAAGQASALYPAGVFRTNDGGRSWSSIPGGAATGWLAGDFLDAQRGAVAGYDGAAATVSERGLDPALPLNIGERPIRCLRLAAPRTRREAIPVLPQPTPLGWLVGDGGLVLLTTDGGRSWREPPGPLPVGMYDQFDYRAVAVWNGACWIAGAPGSKVLHSSDSGRTWQVFDTGHDTPLRALTFLDASRGWAVGSFGTILATRDGGRTWTLQQSGGQRAALLAIFGEPERVPLELLASLGGNEGYLSVAEILHRRSLDLDRGVPSLLAEHTHEAVVAVGGAQAETAWNFPLRQGGLALPAETIVAAWDRLHHGQGQERLLEYLVRRIRQWRPDVIVTEPSSPRGDQPLSHLVNQLVLNAVERAADATSFPEQIGIAGLSPWTVRKVFAALGPDTSGTINLTLSQLAPRLGCSLADYAERGWRLTRVDYTPPPQTLGFATLVNRLGNEVGRKDFFGGLAVATGGEARRALSGGPAGNAQMVTRAAQQRRNVRQLLKRVAGLAQSGAAWLGQLDDLTRGLDDTENGEVLYELAQSLLQAGQWSLAAEVYDQLVRKSPNQPLAEASLVWLVQYHASSEASWAAVRAAAPPAATTNPGTAKRLPQSAAAVAPAAFETPDDPRSPAGLPTAQHHAVTHASSAKDRVRRVSAYTELIQNAHPALSAEPAIRFPLAAIQARADQVRDAERSYHGILGARAHDAWWACAKSELWLLHPTRHSPRPLAICARIKQKPRLDGRLDDEAWKDCLPLSLVSAQQDDADWPASVMLAYDDEFLYVAANCRRAPGAVYPTSQSVRPRDPDLSGHDRVDLLLDVDRDYATYYQLTVDHRGWGREACFGATRWDPTWYIAAQDDSQTWTVEAAIPWSELSSAGPERQQVWALGLQRTVPGVGFQSWSGPAGIRVRPEGFGLLRFD